MANREEDKANTYFIQDSIREIWSYIGNRTFQDFADDEMTLEKVIKLMNNIGIVQLVCYLMILSSFTPMLIGKR